ncbi:MAG: hypothetical protein JM58_05030 [Peptococcaceae bacterium BICA1-8]|nr:MAG: hypothetical protein JM58_05030 [Peptococcaceae bacterium BICA1-8]
MGLLKENLNLNRNLLWASVFLIFGIIVGYFTNINYLYLLFVLLALFLLSVFLYLYKRHAVKVMVVILLFIIGFAWVDWNEKDLYSLEAWHNQIIKVTGQVADITHRDNQVVLEITSINEASLKTDTEVIVKTAWGDSNIYRWGDRVEFQGKLEMPLPQVNPGGFSEREYWRQKGVGYKLSAIKVGQVLEKSKGLQRYTALAREEVYRLIKNSLPKEEAGMLIGLLLGDKKAIDADFYSTAQKMGIAHVFAVSGLHVGVVLAFYLGIARFFKLSHTVTIIGAAFLLGSYSLLVGFTPSVVRASIMGMLAILSVKWLKFKDFYTILAAAAFIIILSDPLSIFTIGFQLSFITTWGLFYFLPLVQRIFHFLPNKMALVLAVPVAAQMASLPITLYYFNTLSLLAPLMNLIVVPIVSILVPLLFVALLSALVWVELALPFILLAGGIAYTLSGFIDYFTRVLSEGHVYLAQPSLIFVGFYYLFLIGFREINSFKEKISKTPFIIKLSIIFILVLLLLVGTIPRSFPLEVAFLDVGQGDGAVLKTPYNQYVIIDGGPGSTTVTQYLRYKGVNKVALVILSHPDADHINGLYKVMQEFTVETLLVPPDIEQSQELRELKSLAEKKKTRIVEGKEGVIIKLQPEVSFQVIAPNINKMENLDSNNASLIVNCTYGRQDFLFTGDVDKEIIEQLLPLTQDIELIKIPHHGSRGSYSERFYQELAPAVAVISVGRGNRYGHPHGEVLEGLGQGKIDVYRTDQQGAVIFYTDGEDMWVKTMLEIVD